MFEQTQAAITLLLQEIAARPQDRHILQESLHEKISAMRATGQPVPDDILRLEKALQDPDSDEFWDNMPV